MGVGFEFEKEIRGLSNWQLNNLLDMVRLEDDERKDVIDLAVDRLLLGADKLTAAEVMELAQALWKATRLNRFP
ncbi:MAG: hypothetical protein ABSF26_20880 [Thermoguttaceae bacterium]|jgi:hypothetical protein